MVNLQEYNSPEWNAAWENFLEHQALEKKFPKVRKSIFLTRLKRDNWELRIDDVWEQTLVASCEAFIRTFSKIYDAYEDECPELGPGSGNFIILRDYLLEVFMEKPPIDFACKKIYLPLNLPPYVIQPGALIRIKAPSKMGKSRLLNGILDFANKQGYYTIHINFLQIESSKFDSLDLFLRWFCLSVSNSLNLEIDLDLDKYSGIIQGCTKFLEEILYTFNQPLVLGLDEVDRLLEYPDISRDFFYLLRYCYEEVNNNELWEKLRLVVVYSTEDFGNLDINQSPFNVGEAIELEPFNEHQIKDLAQLYQLNLSIAEIKQLKTFLGGHPYLVDTIMSHLIRHPEITLASFLEQASTDIGIYSSFLRQHLINLRANDKLAQAFLEIIISEIPIKIDTLLAHQLYRMGLIKWSNSGNTVVPFCELYRLYFLERLSLETSQR